jgi:glycosyl transferase family 87
MLVIAAKRTAWPAHARRAEALLGARPATVFGQRLFAGAAFVVGLVGGFILLSTFGFLDVWEKGIFGNDFSLIWAGPHLFLTGANPYDPAIWQQAILDYGVQSTSTPVFIYPGWVPLFLAPFGAMDLARAAPLWLGLTLFIGAAGLWALLDARLRHLPLAHTMFGFAFIASEPAIVTFYSGQWDFLLVGGLALMALWLTRRPALSAVAASVMLFKPQLFLLAVPLVLRIALARSVPRFLVAFLGVVAVWSLASTVAFPRWWLVYLTVPTTQAGDMRAATLPNGLRDTLGEPGLFAGVALVLILVAVSLLYSPRSRAALPVALAASLSLAPYAFVYDHMLGLVPLAIATGIIGERHPGRALGVAATGMFILFVCSIALHAVPGVEYGTLSFNGIAQFALAALIIGALWPYRRNPEFTG